ncbi:acyl--CoA ligase [Nocardioides sp. JQ2195]|uniref:class I adenylate-forming enzyme family protein n=1 Tax=Nocardioides sp. JQ2195 TaxID=2592334 RepID=UPI00143E918C|nr:class I adenylate-forming enzyme family protein [Nocardioides sp. JQ2195]QIX25494.1 acyl--CoA ligase [Nocardioides sp. JQ2195]
MIRLLARAAAAVPDQVAVVTTEGSPTYADLLRDAHLVAAALLSPRRHVLTRDSAESGRVDAFDRVAIVEPDAAWVIRLLAGAAVAGVEPCQYQPDTQLAELSPQLAAFGHDVVVTRRDDLVEALSAAGVSVVRPESLLTPSTRADSASSGVNSRRLEGSDPSPRADEAQPLLIRTTGTTGEPKAARHDWRVLEQTVARAKPRPHHRWLLAYGPQQFAGIQVLQHVIAAQATLVAPFPRQPRDGLEALLTQDVTCVSATPTYWRFLLTEARSRGVHLPGLEQITLGGEAIPPDLLDELKKAFPTARISQVYASTELGSIVSVGDGRAGFSVDKLVSDTNPDAHLRILDGELWVRRTPGMLGYARAAAARHDEDEWRPTGDLVEVVADRVEFRGRDSEVINVGGVKVHPLPVENAIAALDGVALARVFGRANKLTGAIVAAEVVAADGTDEEDVRRAIKAAVADLPRAWHPRSITFVEAIATRGEKTVRRMEQ